MTTHKILPNWELHTWPMVDVKTQLRSTDGAVIVEINGDDVEIESEAKYEGSNWTYIPRVALQALFDAHDQHVKVVAPESSKE